MPLILTERDVRSVLPMADLIGAMAGALDVFSAGKVVQPVRQVLDVGDKGFFAVMPAVLAEPATAGAKIVTVFPGNHARGLTSHLASILLLNHDTGALEALVDGRYITEARTAAVSAVSVREIARPDASVLAILGSGVQARSHLEAIRCVRSLSDVRVWSPNAEHRNTFACDASAESQLPVRAMRTAADAVQGADIVVFATSAKTPVVRSEDIADGTHICAVGACRPNEREMPSALIARSRLFVDSRAAALKESGDVLLAIAEEAINEHHIAAELGDVVSHRLKGRLSPTSVTIFKSLGLAVEDVVTAHLVVARARAAGLGRHVDLS